jgi:hypothetical protein
MKQLLQNIKTGKASIEDVPMPTPREGQALVQVATSLVSAGTERMVVEFAEKSLVGKARSRPDLVKQVLDKARREGVVNTMQAAFNRLDQPMALGYSSAGTIIALGKSMTWLQSGSARGVRGRRIRCPCRIQCRAAQSLDALFRKMLTLNPPRSPRSARSPCTDFASRSRNSARTSR